MLTGPGSHTLTTSYMLTGVCLSNPDGAWVDSTTFRSRVYHVTLAGPPLDTTLNLAIQGAAAAGTNPPPGNYTATFRLTATW